MKDISSAGNEHQSQERFQSLSLFSSAIIFSSRSLSVELDLNIAARARVANLSHYHTMAKDETLLIELRRSLPRSQNLIA